MATLLLSQGVPMICGGDELGHTQNGNNNAYCQDNDITWFDWDLDEPRRKFLDFVAKLVHIRPAQPVFQRRRFFKGRPIRGVKDITWLSPNGEEMTRRDWAAGFIKCVGVRLAGDLIDDVDEDGERIVGETILILLNAYHEPIPFTLPEHQPDRHWERLFDTADPAAESSFHEGKEAYDLQGRSVVAFRLRSRHEEAGKALSAEQSEKLLEKAGAKRPDRGRVRRRDPLVRIESARCPSPEISAWWIAAVSACRAGPADPGRPGLDPAHESEFVARPRSATGSRPGSRRGGGSSGARPWSTSW